MDNNFFPRKEEKEEFLHLFSTNRLRLYQTAADCYQLNLFIIFILHPTPFDILTFIYYFSNFLFPHLLFENAIKISFKGCTSQTTVFIFMGIIDEE